jgi:hypothetical protein
MKKYAVMLGLLAMGVGSFGADITINDQQNSSYFGTDNRVGINEDQEVAANCVATQDWDLEAFKQDGNLLSMVGGYNFATKTGYLGGDIFIAVDQAPVFGLANVGSGSGNTVVKNTFNYDYAIDLVFNDAGNGGTYNVYQLTSESTVTVYYGQNDGSNPWQYNANGQSAYYTGTFTYNMGLTDAVVGGLQGGIHNQISGIDLSSFIDGNKQFWAHYTMACGNDNLMGHGTTTNVPEPGSFILFGTGLLGLLGLSIGRRKK